jgi:hypothetical protein
VPSRERANNARDVPRVTVSEPTQFFNRKNQMRTGLSHVEALVERPDEFSVLEVVGPGGVGKTRLLRELRDSAKERASSPELVIWVPLSAEPISSAAGPLRRIRNELHFNCLLHDTALLRYWNGTDQPPRLDLANPLSNSLPVRLMQEGGKAAGFPLPVSFGLDLFTYARARWAKASRYEAQEFEAIDELRETPEELLRRLPEFLAIDIVRALYPDQQLIVFYDGYEKQGPAAIANRAPWLRLFLRNLCRGAHFVSSREPLRWDPTEWDLVNSIEVEPLPKTESRELIRSQRKDLDPPTVEWMLKASRRLPLLLEAVVAGSLSADNQSVRGGPQQEAAEDPVGYLLAHLEDPVRELVTAMASVQVFDRELFEELTRELQVGVNVFAFDEFVRSFYIEELGSRLHKTHDLITDFVREAESTEAKRRRALQAVSQYLLRRCLGSDLNDIDALLPILAATVTGWYSVADPSERAIEAIVDTGYLLYDAGYWREVGSLPLSKTERDHPASIAAEFLAALAARRVQGVYHARERFAALGGRVSGLGRHRESVELEDAYLQELSGDYGSARQRFVDLAGRIDRFDPTDRLHVRSRLYLADMQIMDGELASGARLLLDSYEAELLSNLNWAELVRHRGHAFRFSFLPETAVDLYQKAMRAAKKLELASLEAKLWTNLAEARCWNEPSLAIGDADGSDEMNERLGNRIELAKCAAARAIALAKLGKFGPAAASIDTALQHAQEIGYPAAVSFALQARAIALGLQGKRQAATSAQRDLDASLAALGTYPHLAVAPLCAGDEAAEFEREAAKFGWQEAKGVTTRIRECLEA